MHKDEDDRYPVDFAGVLPEWKQMLWNSSGEVTEMQTHFTVMLVLLAKKESASNVTWIQLNSHDDVK